MIFCNYIGFLLLIIWLLSFSVLFLIWMNINTDVSIFEQLFGGMVFHAFFYEKNMYTSEPLPDELIKKLRTVKRINKYLFVIFVAAMIFC